MSKTTIPTYLLNGALHHVSVILDNTPSNQSTRVANAARLAKREFSKIKQIADQQNGTSSNRH